MPGTLTIDYMPLLKKPDNGTDEDDARNLDYACLFSEENDNGKDEDDVPSADHIFMQ